MEKYQPSFEVPTQPKKEKASFAFSKKILRAGALAGALMATPELPAQQVPVTHAENGTRRPYVLYDSSAHSIMLKTGIQFRGTGLYLGINHKALDLMENGEVIGVEILAQGERGLLIKLHKKSETTDGPDKIEKIEIVNGVVIE